MWSVAEPIWCPCFGKESTPPPTQAEAEAVQTRKDCSICTFSCTFQLCFSRYPRHLNRSRWVVVSIAYAWSVCCLPAVYQDESTEVIQERVNEAQYNSNLLSWHVCRHHFSTSCYYILQQLLQFLESLHLLDFHKHIISKELWIVLCKVKLCPGSFWGSGGAGREQQTALWKWSTAGFNLRFWMEDLLKDIQNQKRSAVMATMGHHTGWAGATDGLDGGAETQNSWDVTFVILESLTKEFWLLSDFERWGQTGQTEGEREVQVQYCTCYPPHLSSLSAETPDMTPPQTGNRWGRTIASCVPS